MEITTEGPAEPVVTVQGTDRRTGAALTVARTARPVETAPRAGSTTDAREVRAASSRRVLAAPATSAAAPTRGVRVLLVAFCCLTAAAVVSLVGRADRTAETFAWTIEPSAGAGFLGSAYAAGFVLSVLAVRSRDWRVVRVPFVTVLVFAWITTGSTFFHLHRLHVQDPGTGPVAAAAAWLWLAVYVVVPVAMTVMLPRQPRVARRRRGEAPAAPLPRSLRLVLVGEGGVLAAVGVALVARCLSSHGMPADHAHRAARGSHAVHASDPMAVQAEPLWPWTLSPLGAGVIAAWLLAFAVAVALCVADGDLGRLRIATRAYTAFGAFELLNLLRFRDDVAWSSPAAWVFVVMAVAVTATGAAGWWLARTVARTPEPAATAPSCARTGAGHRHPGRGRPESCVASRRARGRGRRRREHR